MCAYACGCACVCVCVRVGVGVGLCAFFWRVLFGKPTGSPPFGKSTFSDTCPSRSIEFRFRCLERCAGLDQPWAEMYTYDSQSLRGTLAEIGQTPTMFQSVCWMGRPCLQENRSFRLAWFPPRTTPWWYVQSPWGLVIGGSGSHLRNPVPTFARC